MNALLPLMVAVLSGIGVALQPPTNATLSRASGSPLLAALISFAAGTLILLIAWAAVDRTSPATLKGLPAWAWFGGAYGAFFVAATAYAAPRLGLAQLLTIMIAMQLITALILDHFGLLALERTPVSASRIVGIMLVLGGAVLVRRG
ncbi:DMT family transporter [Sphingomonas japonica]|uniref:Transporter family-2 protein n=1 Tax=Sphingomonas japonica TaxID=511662 RepID=A0ABX0U4I7_9SPHN|nr:DMT family transporter [Sphingomonas japonica]NIJ24576.1 transporter family-2 protein [Sphingomonas japonica]